ncbi:MAG: crotonase/enoyl-CoA hydratase family protein [Betaproteobacteria bacterium]|nr:MAG: crotonase/enoyl-CoA hydratase family protein [Betaproteobacteria bacterium]
MADEVIVEVHDGIQVIRINRPDKKNALKRDMYDRMAAALIAGDASDDVAAHVFLGVNGVFTAGNDISDFANQGGAPRGNNHRDDKQRDDKHGAPGFIRLLPMVSKPMIAAVDGLAVGIGTTMLFHCDLVFASAGASLRTPFVDLGLVPEAGSSMLAPMRMGQQRAFELLCLGEPFDGQRAYEAGLVNRVVASEELEATAMKAAARLAMKPPGALAASRRLMRGDPAALLAQIENETEIFAERLASDEAKEAFSAFLEKRKPDFSQFRRQT